MRTTTLTAPRQDDLRFRVAGDGLLGGIMLLLDQNETDFGAFTALLVISDRGGGLGDERGP